MSEGTWGHSSQTNRYFITASDDDEKFRKFLADSKINNKEVRGHWMGMDEAAWVINQDNLGAVFESGLINKQLYVLMLGLPDARDRNPAILHPISAEGGPQNLGLYQNVSREYALSHHPGYTYDETQDKYFVAGPDMDIPTSSNPVERPVRHVQ